jgi:DNA-binding GntR family transcriptional regulator
VKATEKTTLVDKIYYQIKRAIVNREIPPGTKLSEEVLANILNVSRTPVRAALQKLSFEKLVDISPRKGASIANPTAKEVKEVFEMRILLEEYTVEMACRNFKQTDDIAARLKHVLAVEEKAYKDKDFSNVLEQVHNFHIEIAKLCNNGLIIRNLQELILLTNIYITFYSEMSIDSPNSPREHLEILHAIENNDVASAKHLMRRHIEGVSSRLNFNLMRNYKINLQDILLRQDLDVRE